MKKMSYILLLGFLCCIFGGALCVLGYVRGGMEYVEAANVLPQPVVKKMETAFSGKGGPNGGVSQKDSSSSASMEENGGASHKGNSAAIEENGSNENTILKSGKDGKKYNFQLSKKKLQGFDTIKGDLKHVDMKIVPSDTKDAYITYKLTAKKNSNPFSYQVKNSTLILSEKEGMLNTYYQYVRTGKVLEQRNTNLVTLYLPKKQLKSTVFTLGEGDISIKGLNTKTAEVTLQDGDMWLETSTVKGGSMKTKNGDFIFEKVTCENCKFTSENGDFQCSNFTVKKSELAAENGDFIFGNSASEGCKITSENGDFQCSGFTMKNGTLSSENGDVDLLKSTITSCNLSAECGDIIVEDTTVSGKAISSDDGDLDFIRSVVKNCKISTGSGDIDGDKLKVSGNVILVGEESDIQVTLETSCKTKINIYAYTEDGSLEKSGKFKGKVRKRGDTRTYSRDVGSKSMLKIITEDGDIILD